jgi:hypothetical protein
VPAADTAASCLTGTLVRLGFDAGTKEELPDGDHSLMNSGARATR